MRLLAVGVIGGGILYYMNNANRPKGIAGPGIDTIIPIEHTARLADGRLVYCAQNVVQGYTTNIVMIASDGETRYIPTPSNQAVNISEIFNPSQWAVYWPNVGYKLVM